VEVTTLHTLTTRAQLLADLQTERLKWRGTRQRGAVSSEQRDDDGFEDEQGARWWSREEAIERG
jgi:hypothetical protein